MRLVYEPHYTRAWLRQRLEEFENTKLRAENKALTKEVAALKLRLAGVGV